METALLLAVIPVFVVCYFGWRAYKRRIPGGWVIGPIVNGKNYSKGCPLRPEITPGGWRVTGGEPHYVTKAGYMPLTVKYRVTGACEAVEGGTPAVSFHFHRKGDDWKRDDARWYSLAWFPLTEGEHEASVSLASGEWVNVMGGQDGFATDIGRGGLVFGNTSNRGHGVRFSGSFEVLEMRP